MDDNSFSSIDRLMEFGMSMGIAQQMINTMNQSLNSMYVPNAGQKISPTKNGYYIIIDNRQLGPLNEDEISILAKNGRLSENDFVWKEGMTGWRLAKEIPEIYKYIILYYKPYED